VLEEIVVLVEVFDRVGVIGARALHELMELAWRVMLGLLARVINRGDQRGVGRSTTIFSVLLPLLRGGALVLILVLGLALAPASVGVRWERRLLEVLDKGPRSQAIRAGTLVAPACVSVQPEPRVGRRSVRSGRQVKARCQCDLLCHARRPSW